MFAPGFVHFFAASKTCSSDAGAIVFLRRIISWGVNDDGPDTGVATGVFGEGIGEGVNTGIAVGPGAGADVTAGAVAGAGEDVTVDE